MSDDKRVERLVDAVIIDLFTRHRWSGWSGGSLMRAAQRLFAYEDSIFEMCTQCMKRKDGPCIECLCADCPLYDHTPYAYRRGVRDKDLSDEARRT